MAFPGQTIGPVGVAEADEVVVSIEDTTVVDDVAWVDEVAAGSVEAVELMGSVDVEVGVVDVEIGVVDVEAVVVNVEVGVVDVEVGIVVGVVDVEVGRVDVDDVEVGDGDGLLVSGGWLLDVLDVTVVLLVELGESTSGTVFELVVVGVVVLVATVVVVAVVVVSPSLYSCSLTPAPQYSDLSPGQVKEQSFWLLALMLPAFRSLPQ